MGNFRPRNPFEYLRILWRRKWLIILFATAMLIATYVAMKPVPNVYEAKAVIAIALQSSDERNAVDVQVAMVNQYLLSRSNLEPLVNRYSLYNVNSATTSTVSKEAKMEVAVQQLRREVKLETKLRDYYPQFPEFFTITYRHTDPLITQQVTNDLASFFNNTNEMMEKQFIEEAKSLDAAISEVEGRIKQINQQRSASQSSGNLNAIRMQRASLSTAIDSLSDKEYALSQQLAEQKRQVSEQEKIAKALPANDGVRGSSSYGVLLVRKAQLEAQLKDYLTQYTEKNTKVVQTRTEIAEVNRQLAALDAPGTQNGNAPISNELRELRALQREQARLETDLEITQRELSRKRAALAILPDIGGVTGLLPPAADNGIAIPSDNGKDLELNSEYNLLFNRYTSLTERRDSLKRGGAAKTGIDSALFRVVDRASVPHIPVAPDRMKMMLMAFAMSLVIGLAVAVVVEVPQMTLIHDDLDVQYYLGAPVIAMIPETLTPAESGRKRRLFLMRALGILLLATSLVPIFAVILKKLQVFQMLAK